MPTRKIFPLFSRRHPASSTHSLSAPLKTYTSSGSDSEEDDDDAYLITTDENPSKITLYAFVVGDMQTYLQYLIKLQSIAILSNVFFREENTALKKAQKNHPQETISIIKIEISPLELNFFQGIANFNITKYIKSIHQVNSSNQDKMIAIEDSLICYTYVRGDAKLFIENQSPIPTPPLKQFFKDEMEAFTEGRKNNQGHLFSIFKLNIPANNFTFTNEHPDFNMLEYTESIRRIYHTHTTLQEDPIPICINRFVVVVGVAEELLSNSVKLNSIPVKDFFVEEETAFKMERQKMPPHAFCIFKIDIPQADFLLATREGTFAADIKCYARSVRAVKAKHTKMRKSQEFPQSVIETCSDETPAPATNPPSHRR